MCTGCEWDLQVVVLGGSRTRRWGVLFWVGVGVDPQRGRDTSVRQRQESRTAAESAETKGSVRACCVCCV